MGIQFNKNSEKLEIIYDGEVKLTVQCHKDRDYALPYYTEDVTEELVAIICQSTVEDFPEEFEFSSSYNSKEFKYANWVEIKKETEVVDVLYAMTFIWESWNHPFTVGELVERLKEQMDGLGYTTAIVDVDFGIALNVTFKVHTGSICQELSKVASQVSDEFDDIAVRLSRSNSQSLFVKTFKFPKGYESICTQYLIWFGEFLSGMGFDTDVSTEKLGEKTSLIVSPNDAPELLEKIESLFYQYMSLPYVEYLPSNNNCSSVQERFAIELLTSQVENFKNQIRMKEAIIEMKEASISSLRNTLNENEKKLLLLDSLQNKPEVEFFEGAICVGELSWGPFKLNPRKLIESLSKKI